MSQDALDLVDPGFRQDLLESESAVYAVSSYFRRKGYRVFLPPIRVRPSGKSVFDYSDETDLVVEKDGRFLRIEVKRRPELKFQSKADFPFPTLIVDAAHHYDRLLAKPDFYFILNADGTVAFTFPGNESSAWSRRRIFSSKRGRERDYYEVALDGVRVVAVVPEAPDA